MTKDDALKMALECAERCESIDGIDWSDTIDAIKEALAQPEQEPVRLQCVTCGTVYADGVPPQVTQPEQKPVAWTVAGQVRDWGKDFSAYQTQHYVRPIYTSPPKREWVGLTEDEIDSALGVYDSFGGRLDARNIEAKLKEKSA